MGKPNFLFILIDDLGWRDLGCYGSTFYETPNLDRLASEGTRFTNAYAACPVCSPTRASILTGKYPARVGITNFIGGNAEGRLLPVPYLHYLPLEEKTIARALKEHGYTTYHVGKWHLGDKGYWPGDHGFDVNVAGCGWGAPRTYFSPYGNPMLEDGPEGEYLTDRLTTEAISLLERSAASDAPFFMYMSYYAVHIPIQAPEHLVEKYRKKARALGLDKVKTFEIGEEIQTLHLQGVRVKRRLVQSDPAYAAMVERLDWNIGRLLAAIDNLGMREDTVVFFFSDNGGLSTQEGSPTCNAPLRDGKGWMYEGGSREPLIVRWPGVVPAGETCNVALTSTDFYPTMLSMAGLPLMPDQHVDGRSFAGLFSRDPDLRDETAAMLASRPVFWHYPHYSNQGGTPYSAIRRGNFKLIEFFEDGRLELYDLASDIGETRDIASLHPDIVSELHALLKAWRGDVSAVIPRRNEDWPHCKRPDYVRVAGRLVLDGDGVACIKMQLTAQNPLIYDVPILDILDAHVGKELSFRAGSTTVRGKLLVKEGFPAGSSAATASLPGPRDSVAGTSWHEDGVERLYLETVGGKLMPVVSILERACMVGKFVALRALTREDDGTRHVVVDEMEDPTL